MRGGGGGGGRHLPDPFHDDAVKDVSRIDDQASDEEGHCEDAEGAVHDRGFHPSMR